MCQKVDAGGLPLLNSPNKDLKLRENHNDFKRKLKANTFRHVIIIFFMHRFRLSINLC